MNDTLKDYVGKTMNAVHRRLFDLTKGKGPFEKVGKMHAVKLTTTGRKSGQPRSTMLTTPVVDDEGIYLVASWGGDDRHPQWYKNLEANPTVTITMSGEEWQGTASTVSAEEKAALWPQITSAYKGYQGYQESTDREIPVVRVTRN